MIQGNNIAIDALEASKTDFVEATSPRRIFTVDALRGIALLLMAFHHTAIFAGTYPGAATYNNLPYTPESFPHWILSLFTHIAAPTFWFIGGISIALYVKTRRQKGVSEWEITKFLLTRAGLIILIDLTLGSLLWPDHLGNTHVLISIGISIALISILRLMPRWLFMSFAVILLATYQWLVGLIFTQWNIPSGFWPELWLTNSEGGFPALEFPILGWITIMAFGYILGRQMSSPVFSRPYFWSGLGGCLLGGWLILRWAGSFGDLNPYVDGDHWYYFFNMSKSPPSLTYQAFYIGLAMFFMAILFAYGDWLKTQPGRWLVTVGQVPLFFFVIHPAVFRPLAYLITSMNTSLPVTFQAWVVWLLGLSLLIPLSFGYRRLRQNNPGSILRYL